MAKAVPANRWLAEKPAPVARARPERIVTAGINGVGASADRVKTAWFGASLRETETKPAV
jgi:hypothetical protein